MKLVYLGLGSNLGDRQANLERAIKGLEANEIRILSRSSLYETEPQDIAAQPWFLNMAVKAETDLFPRRLLACVHRIEASLGRRRVVAKGPRIIDIDILLYGDTVITTPELVIPHPRMQDRRFVLEPLLELSPNLRHPISGRTVLSLIGDVQGQEVQRLPVT